MQSQRRTNTQERKPTNFDPFRIAASKTEVGACPNTVRAYIAEGLPSYRNGKAVWISRTELDGHIRRRALKAPNEPVIQKPKRYRADHPSQCLVDPR